MKKNTETTNRCKILRALLLFLDGDVLSLLQGKCTHLSDGHGAENVEEDEGAVSVILTQEVAVGEALDVREGDKRELCHHPAIKSGKESTASPLETAKGLFGYRKEQVSIFNRPPEQVRPQGKLKGLAAFSSPSTPRRIKTSLSPSPPQDKIPSGTVLP